MENSSNRVNLEKTLTIYSCPRFLNGSIIADGRAPLTKYISPIYANNCKKILEDGAPEKQSIANFTKQDGMLYYLGQMRKRAQFSNKGIKVLICVCMYNQSRFALETTLKGIYANLPALNEIGIGTDDIAVIVIQDGILKLVKDRVLRTFQKGANSVIEFYRDLDLKAGKNRCDLIERINIVLDQIDNFSRKRMEEFVTKNRDFPRSIQKNLSLVYQNLWSPNPHDVDKLKVISCFKHINGTKLSSHLWFFEGFCRHINPHFCVLLDVGTQPDQKGIANLITGFTSKGIGGVTGLMSVDSEFKSEQGQQKEEASTNCWDDWKLFSIEKAQEFQYIISHFIDKNCQSATGFLHVLPGAWSAYRYEALIHGEKFEQNLLERKYFKMILDPNIEQRDYKEANMYLAEDRILSLGIYCQQQKDYILKYVPKAIAYTDPMKSLQELMKQRRRWINSSYFAFEYVNRNYYFNVMQSTHNCWRRYVLLPLSMFLANLSIINGYFIPSFYLFVLYTTIIQSGSAIYIPYLANISCLIYILTVFVCIGGSLIGDLWTKHAQKVSYIFSLYTYVLIAMVTWNVVDVYLQASVITSFADLDFISWLVLAMTCLNVGSYIVIALIHLPSHPKFVFKLLCDGLSYLGYQGAYSHVMVIYSFCNIDDVSWGTKGVKSSGKKKYSVEKVFFVCNWIFWNAMAAFIFIFVDFFIPRRNGSRGYVLLAIGVYATLLMTIKTVLAIYNHFVFYLSELFTVCKKKQPDDFRTTSLKNLFSDRDSL